MKPASDAAAAALEGTLDFASVGGWLAHADAIADSGVVPLGPVTHVDSAGLSLLLEVKRRAQHRGRTLRLDAANAQLRQLARFFEVDTILGLDAPATVSGEPA